MRKCHCGCLLPKETHPSHQDTAAFWAKHIWPFLERSLRHTQHFVFHPEHVSVKKKKKRKMSLSNCTHPQQILSNLTAGGVLLEWTTHYSALPPAPRGAAAGPSLGRIRPSVSLGHTKRMSIINRTGLRGQPRPAAWCPAAPKPARSL